MLDEAKKVAESTGDRAALFHVARQCEYLPIPRIEEAMALYAKAGTPVMAVRLAKSNGRDKDLLRYALDCNSVSRPRVGPCPPATASARLVTRASSVEQIPRIHPIITPPLF